MNFFRKIIYLCAICPVGHLWAQEADPQTGKIERLDPPKAAAPPGTEDDGQAAEDLRRKRQQRQEREKSLEPPEQPYGLVQKKKLLKEALIPRERSLVLEISVLAGTIQTRQDRGGYTFDPTSHFNVFYRYDAKRKNGRIGPWFGLRVAPFAGTGFQKRKPGSYGLTYFGPMIGVGKINPVPTEEGKALRTEIESEVNIPAIDGWLIGAGIAAVSKAGRSNDEDPAKSSDFATTGAAFDSPGIWLEGRYLKILYGALGYNVIFGVQTGKNKEFIYTGIGLSGWD